MGRRLRCNLGERLVEVTTRTQQGRYLLRPSSIVNLQIKGTLGRAQRQTGLRVCAVVFLSNHYHLLAIPEDEQQLANFMRFVNSNIARQMGRLHDWSGGIWSRRYQAIPVSEEPEAQIARLRYLLEHGVKENLVKKPADWPGVHCVPELLSGSMRLHGTWHDRSSEYRARRSGRAEEKIRSRDFIEREQLDLVPVPCLREHSRKRRKKLLQELVLDIEREARERRRRTSVSVLGVKRILTQDPLDRPRKPKRSPAPIAHAATFEVWREMRECYRQFVNLYRAASERLRAGLTADFPDGCFLPPMPYRPRLPAGIRT